MAKISGVTQALKKFSGKPLGAASKVLGAATALSVVYDAHINGKEKAASLDEIASADRILNQHNQYMTMEKPSATLAKMKKIWYDMQQNFSSYYHVGTKIKGYLTGFGKTVVEDLPLLGLSAAALMLKNAGKAAGVLLAANGAKALLYDVIGIGAKKNKHND